MKNILVVDDNQVVLNSLASYLRFKFKDFEILSAPGGKEAIEMLDTHSVSLILTDLEMPKVDGYQVIAHAKKKYPCIPVIFMTGSWSLDLEMLVSQTGVVRCIEKPFRFEELELKIFEALREGSKEAAFITPATPNCSILGVPTHQHNEAV